MIGYGPTSKIQMYLGLNHQEDGIIVVWDWFHLDHFTIERMVIFYYTTHAHLFIYIWSPSLGGYNVIGFPSFPSSSIQFAITHQSLE